MLVYSRVRRPVWYTRKLTGSVGLSLAGPMFYVMGAFGSVINGTIPYKRRARQLPLVCLAGLFVAFGPLSLSSQADLQQLFRQAENRLEARDYSGAERVYQQALRLAPDDLETLKRLGMVYQIERKFQESITLFQQGLARNSQYPEMNYFLGRSYFESDDFTQAIGSFERELQTSHPHPQCQYYLALALQREGRLDEAVSHLNQSPAKNPKDADVLYLLARIYKNRSVQITGQLMDLDPNSFQVHVLMGETFAEEENYPDAISEWRLALAKRPDATGLHYAIGLANWYLLNFEEAERELLEARRERQNDSLTNFYLGDIAVKGQRFEEALGYLHIAEAGRPQMADVHFLLAKCHEGLGDLEKAKSELLVAANLDPNAAKTHYLLAQIYRKLNNEKASASELAQFEKLSRTEKHK